jgi:Transglycosylase SLT domain
MSMSLFDQIGDAIKSVPSEAWSSLGYGLVSSPQIGIGLANGLGGMASVLNQQRKQDSLANLFQAQFSKWNPEQQQIAKALIASGNQDAVMQLVTRDAFPTPEEQRRQQAIDMYQKNYGPGGDPHNPPVKEAAPASVKPQSIAKGYDAYKAKFDAVQQQYPHIPIGLLPAMGQTESSFNPAAVGPVVHGAQGDWQAQGIGQFNPDTAKSLGIDPMNPDQAIPAMGQLLNQHMQTYGGDINKALAAYGGGLVNGEITPNGQKYVDKVMSLAQLFGGKGAPTAVNAPDGSVDPRAAAGATAQPQASNPLQALGNSIQTQMDALDAQLPDLERRNQVAQQAGIPDSAYENAVRKRQELQTRLDQVNLENAKLGVKNDANKGLSYADLPPERQAFVDQAAAKTAILGDLPPSVKTGLGRNKDAQQMRQLINDRAAFLNKNSGITPEMQIQREAMQKAWRGSLNKVEALRAFTEANLSTAQQNADQIASEAPKVLANSGFRSVNDLIMATQSQLNNPQVAALRAKVIETGTVFARIISGQTGAAATPTSFIKQMSELGLGAQLNSSPAEMGAILGAMEQMANSRYSSLDGQENDIIYKISHGQAPQGAKAPAGKTPGGKVPDPLGIR